MSALTRILADTDLHRLQQAVRWIVYTLPPADFASYVDDGRRRESRTLTADAGPADRAAGFATAIDEAAAWLSHWLHARDVFAWIADYAVIRMNVNEWHDELASTAAESAG